MFVTGLIAEVRYSVTEFIAPIALFVYNRPKHTLRTLEALSRNEGASASRLFVFSDGLKENANSDEQARLKEVRSSVRAKSWCGAVEIVESDINKGLAKSICDGISRVLEDYDRVIVLEDDLETSAGFLRYMNDALQVYSQDEKVFQVSGFMVRSRPWAAQTGFLRVSTSWGWATWSRAWKHFRNDADNQLKEVEIKGRDRFDLDGFSFHFDELKRNTTGDLKTWAVRWYASIFLLGGLCLYPKRSLVRNCGFDGTGIHCGSEKTNYHNSLPTADFIHVERIEICESRSYLCAMQRHYEYLYKMWTNTRIQDRIIRKLNRFCS